MATSCPGTKFPFFEIASSKPSDKENLVLSFQRAATADGFKFRKYGCDGSYGEETKSVMQKCVVKRRLLYKYKNATKLVQQLLNLKQDGLCGPATEQAIKNFQKKNNLVIDGCCGFNTWKVLLNIK
jgi:peptidoglycan hydrolase-like protein with peptidoglycan-binding domain